MKTYTKIGILGLLTTPLIAGVLWIGSSGEKQASVLPLTHNTPVATLPTTAANVSTSQVAPTPTSSPTVVEATPTAKPVVLTAEQRQFILAEFVKAADKDIAKVQHALEEAKTQGAPPEQIAAQENKLRMMQQFKLDALARNAG